MSIGIRREQVAIPIAGGGKIYGDLYRPEAPSGAIDTLLVRTPYGRENYIEEGVFWAKAGYACLIQDVRGRYESDGHWKPYQNEYRDGMATAEWISECAWGSGKLVASGSSYAAFAAWSVAVGAPDVVAGIISRVPAMGMSKVKLDYPSGVLRLADHTAWWLRYGQCRTERPRLAKLQLENDPRFFDGLPVDRLKEKFWASLDAWEDALGPNIDAGARLVSDEELGEIQAPSLHIGGWHDSLLHATISTWKAVGARAPSKPARRLIIGPWSHRLTANGIEYGERHYGPASRVRLGSWELAWLKSAVAERDPADSAEFFIMGSNEWKSIDANGWLAKRGRRQWYAAGDGMLQLTPAKGCVAAYRYDPSFPCPSRNLPVDRSDLADRPDVLCFDSPPLSHRLVILGSPIAHIVMESDCPTTDIVVRLCEICNGRRIPIVRGCYVLQQEFVGQQARSCRIELPPTAIEIPRGHGISLEITSSDFPDLCRNLNTLESRTRGSRVSIAWQKVVIGGLDGTRIEIPETVS